MVPNIPLIIRSERPADAQAIHHVTEAAFRAAVRTSHTEAFIVRALRAAGELTVSLVAEAGGEVIGHVAVSPVRIDGAHDGWYGLGPLSVLPGHQGLGIGAQLTWGVLDALRALGARVCVVLGNPAYYTRFGFRADARLVLPGVPASHFMAITLRASTPSGVVAYSAAFEATS